MVLREQKSFELHINLNNFHDKTTPIKNYILQKVSWLSDQGIACLIYCGKIIKEKLIKGN